VSTMKYLEELVSIVLSTILWVFLALLLAAAVVIGLPLYLIDRLRRCIFRTE
jgi:hypothetical protein